VSESTRTFVALCVPDSLVAHVEQLVRELAPCLPGCRWVAARPFHATLAFLGDVPNRDIDSVCAAVAAAAGSIQPFPLELCGLGAFPNPSRPRVIWAGLTAQDPAPLSHLRAEVVRALERARYSPDHQRFHAHVTLGRFKFPPRGKTDTAALLGRYQSWSGGTFSVTEVITFASTRNATGPVYAPLGVAPLISTQAAGPTRG
jgi:2'-5' RNA ligase